MVVRMKKRTRKRTRKTEMTTMMPRMMKRTSLILPQVPRPPLIHTQLIANLLLSNGPIIMMLKAQAQSETQKKFL